MKCGVAPRTGEAILTTAQPETRVRIRGIPASELAARLGIGPGATGRWCVPGRRIRVGDGPETLPAASDVALVTHEFPDATVRLASGTAGELEIKSHSAEEPDLPLPRSLLLLITQQWALQGAMALHAALVEFEGMHILMLGDSGHGKSTLCLSALAAGGRVVSDDWVLVGGESGLTGTGLRPRLGIRSEPIVGDLLAGFGLAPMPDRTACARIEIDPEPLGRSMEQAPIDGIFLLHKSETSRPAKSRWRPIRSEIVASRIIAGISGLLVSGKFPAERAALWNLIRRLVQLPAWELVSGVDAVSDPRAFWRRSASRASHGAPTAGSTRSESLGQTPAARNGC